MDGRCQFPDESPPRPRRSANVKYQVTAASTRPRVRCVDRNLQKTGGCERGPSNARNASDGPPPKQSATAPAFVPNTIKLMPALPPGAAQRAMPPMWRVPYDLSSMVRADLSPPPLASISALFQLLMPRDVQMVPLSLIGPSWRLMSSSSGRSTTSCSACCACGD